MLGKHSALMVSLISWGFHYPIATYLNLVVERLNEGGRLILDVRRESGGREARASPFAACDVICEDAKFERVLCQRKTG